MLKIISLLLVLFMFGCADNPAKPTEHINYINDKKDQEKYAKKTKKDEEKIISERRGRLHVPEHDPIGIAMSGGGIRSNAFQLGLLTGLFEKKKNKNDEKSVEHGSVLDKVDYISAVSGGSWAAAAYKNSSETDGRFFKNLKDMANVEEDISTALQHKYLFNSYESSLSRFNKSLKISDILDLHKGYYGDDAWRFMLLEKILDSDPLLTTLETEGSGKDRPFLIMNVTHDASFNLITPNTKEDMKSNFPGEFTALHFGSFVDCRNVPGYCSLFNTHKNAVGVFYEGEVYKNMMIRLSHAAAISGSVAPPSFFHLMDTQLSLPDYKTYESSNVREKYFLSDGGHSENLGAFALIYRDVKVIIISDAAADQKYTNDDLEVLKHHAKEILGYHVDLDVDNTKKDNYYIGSYCKANEAGKDDHCPEDSNVIIYLKSPDKKTLKQSFFPYLKENESHLYTYMTTHFDDLEFPMDDTYAASYEPNLLKSYYALGRYVANTKLYCKIENYVKSNNIKDIKDLNDCKDIYYNDPSPSPTFSPNPCDCNTLKESIKKLDEKISNLKPCACITSKKPTRDICETLDLKDASCKEDQGNGKIIIIPYWHYKPKKWNHVDHVDLTDYLKNIAKRITEVIPKYDIEIHGYASFNKVNCFNILFNEKEELGKNYYFTNKDTVLIPKANSNSKIEPACSINNDGNLFLSFLRSDYAAQQFLLGAKNLTNYNAIGHGSFLSKYPDNEDDRYISIVVTPFYEESK